MELVILVRDFLGLGFELRRPLSYSRALLLLCAGSCFVLGPKGHWLRERTYWTSGTNFCSRACFNCASQQPVIQSLAVPEPPCFSASQRGQYSAPSGLSPIRYRPPASRAALVIAQ